MHYKVFKLHFFMAQHNDKHSHSGKLQMACERKLFCIRDGHVQSRKWAQLKSCLNAEHKIILQYNKKGFKQKFVWAHEHMPPYMYAHTHKSL